VVVESSDEGGEAGLELVILVEGDDLSFDVDDVARCVVVPVGVDDNVSIVASRPLFDRGADRVARDRDQSQDGVRRAEARIFQQGCLSDRVVETWTSGAG
jgi:hypothetical protein